MREATKRRFMCKECPKSYAQQQGLNRHYGKKHNPNLCKCCKFEWIRPYEYRAHLEKCHPDENPDEVLGKPAKSHRRTAAFVGRRPQHDLPPISGYDGQGHSENRPYPPAVAESSTITPHPHSMNYVPQPESMQVNESSPEGTVDRFMLQALPAVVSAFPNVLTTPADYGETGLHGKSIRELEQSLPNSSRVVISRIAFVVVKRE